MVLVKPAGTGAPTRGQGFALLPAWFYSIARQAIITAAVSRKQPVEDSDA